jgi:hypothetical protein
VTPRAPLYTDAYDLAAWLLGHLDRRGDALSRDTCRVCLLLLDAVVLALKNRDRWERLDQADEALLRLRQRIRLAEDRGIFDQRQALHALARCDRIGRQIGGWQRSLEEAQ